MHRESARNYDDIINLPAPVSTRHARMPLYKRAAQFAPFAALTGHAEAIAEAARFTQSRLELDENAVDELNRRLLFLAEAGVSAEAAFTYFIADERKNGGKYVTHIGTVGGIDEYSRTVILTDGTRISVCELLSIEGDIFDQPFDGLM